MDLEKFLVDATLEVFASMIFIEIEAQTANDEPVAAFSPNITSLIGLAGDLKGILAIHCPENVALDITSAMLGMEVAELGEDAKDAIGEITNMVAGGLKVAIADKEKKIALAIPTTVIGHSIRTAGLSGATRLMIPFTCPTGRFGIEFRYIFT
ncbi:MAG: chemotaxis protein CheX [Desulfobulbus sp.]|nr:chemotaxis protein CheX [Desulfobulbus sp.]